LQDQWNAIISGESKGVLAGIARAGLQAISALHGLGLSASLLSYSHNLRRRTVPALPVISVGNLTLGGTGKTTAAAFIARRLNGATKPGIVLSGYRRQSGASPLIVSDGEQLRASLGEAGDEAYMLATQLPGCAVAVGKRREDVILALQHEAGVGIAILDDGFQYFRMVRNLDIVLVDALSHGTACRLFPAGRLREPMANMRRADQVWITHADLVDPARVDELAHGVALRCNGRAPVVTRHRASSLRPLQPGGYVPDSIAGRRVLALSALGNPLAFDLALSRLGCDVVPLSFPDHHDYAPGDYERVVAAARAAGVELVVTTEKDAVKLPVPPPQCPPVVVQGCELEVISGEETLAAGLEAVCIAGLRAGERG